MNTLISKNACWPEIQSPLAAISTLASSVIFAVLLFSDSPVSCRSVGSINTSWHMTFRRFAVRSRIWLWRGLIKPPFLHERPWSMVKRAPHSQVVGSRCSCHPHRSRSSSWWCSLPLLWVVVSQVDAPYCWFISFNRRCSLDISFRSLCKTEWWRACLLFRILFLFYFRSCLVILFRRSSDMIRYPLFPFLSLLGKNSIFNVFILSKFKKYTRN